MQIKKILKKIGDTKLKDVARTIVAPINPLDTKNKLNIGGNIVRGAEKIGKVIKEKAKVQSEFRNKWSTKEAYEQEYARLRSNKPNRF